MIKVRLIQAMIQIARPVAWGVGRIKGLALELKCIELYNSVIVGKKEAIRCYDIKMVKSPGYSSVGMPPCG